MRGLIQKSGYIKPGNGGGHYAEYIATRDGVEVIEPAAGGYLEYMAERPRSHGLFSADGAADLEQTMEEINAHTGPVWTFVYSLKREDAARLGYESGESWRRLLLAHQTELAMAMKIPPNSFRWCAAFHDEKHHPHIHMMAWSNDSKQGYLTQRGIEQMRSQLSNDIFQDELLSLYQEKDLSYQEVRDAAMEAMGRLIREMKSNLCDSPVLAGQMETLSDMLSETKGKKVYGYLKKPVKAQVDAIVDELAKLPEVAECYEHWNRLRDELERYYKDTPREYKPLSQQKEFKAIKNMVIQEADNLQLSVFTFEDTQMKDEVDEDQDAVLHAWSSRWEMADAYQDAKEILSVYENTEAEKAEQVRVLERLWDAGFTVAAHQLGKCWRDGLGVLPDDEKAESWFRYGAEAGYDFSQYALGKLLQSRNRLEEAVSWYEKAAEQDNPYAAYQLGKLYLQGKQVPKDVAMGKRRPSGDGMVRKREDGRWEGRIVVGHKENGDPIFRYIYADTQKELTAKLRQSIEAYQGVELTEESRMTLGQWLDQWLENMTGTIRPVTMKRYEGTVARHIKPYLGEKIISQVTGKDIQKLYDTLAHHGNRNTGEGLASGTIRGIHAMFHEAMGAAQQAGLIPRNPTEDIDAPKFSYKGKKVLTDEQLEKFMGIIQRDSVWCDFFYTELTTGLRRGEICGLKWEDFDEAHSTLKVRRTIHEEKGGKLTAWDTKTAAGTRTIHLSPSTAALLRERKKTALTEWIFPHPWKPEQPTRPSAAYERMKVLLKEAELPDLRFHDLRHTFATHALTSGVDVKTLSGILGHTRAAFTLDTYTHTTGDMQKRAAEIVEEFLIDIFGEELKPWEESGKMAKAPSG